tara:strand:- start:4781 stop:5455 length:675 start_codon:yes stop_codon:yes gene_type:complete
VWVIFTLTVVGILVKLGLWQLSRAEQAQSRMIQFQKTAQTTQPLSLTHAPHDAGQWVVAQGEVFPEYALLLDNQTLEGRVGYKWLMPFYASRVDLWLLLDLGFISASGRDVIPTLPQVERYQQIQGQIYAVSKNPLNHELKGEPGFPKRIQALDMAALRAVLHRPLVDYILRLDKIGKLNLASLYKPSQIPYTKHLGYAVQWFAMAGVFLILMIIYRRRSKDCL